MCYSVMVKQNLQDLSHRFDAVFDEGQVRSYLEASLADPKNYPPLNPRIYPGGYAPVIYLKNGHRRISLMRYGAYSPEHIKNRAYDRTFNARLDNLTSSFWSEAFKKFHGFIILNHFYEWVAVRDLIKAGLVGIDEIEHTFQIQRDNRKKKLLASGKPYKQTSTERKDTLDRNVIIEFSAIEKDQLLVPVIFSIKRYHDKTHAGFAIITDEPPQDVLSAGHDRCPVHIREESINDWLHVFPRRSYEAYCAILKKTDRVSFRHRLDPTLTSSN